LNEFERVQAPHGAEMTTIDNAGEESPKASGKRDLFLGHVEYEEDRISFGHLAKNKRLQNKTLKLKHSAISQADIVAIPNNEQIHFDCRRDWINPT